MLKSWLLYLVVSMTTRSPLLGILAVLAFWYLGTGWWLGRLPNPFAPLKELLRVRELRGELGVNPHNLNVRAELGGLLVRRRPAEARELLAEVVRRAPELPLPRYHLGLAQLALGETESGQATIEEALRIRPDLRFGEPLVRLGDHHAGRGAPAVALAAYERATEVHSSFAEAWYKAGAAARATGDLGRARALFTETLTSTEHSPAFKRREDRSWRWRAWWALRRL